MSNVIENYLESNRDKVAGSKDFESFMKACGDYGLSLWERTRDYDGKGWIERWYDQVKHRPELYMANTLHFPLVRNMSEIVEDFKIIPTKNNEDAELISRAPEMLETLKDIESYCETHGELGELIKLTGLKEIIKKVEG